MNLAIIGCGASALYLASRIKGHNITIFEKNKKIASKLLASGNGKCNILNLGANPLSYNHEEFISDLFKRVDVKFLYDTLLDMGISLKSDNEGRVYPISESSQMVLDVMLDNVNANIITEYKVESITKKNSKYYINDFKTPFDKVILASGSYASINRDKMMDCYNYLNTLGISLTKLSPSLVGFKAKGVKEISGVRVKANVSLYNNKKNIHTESGEVIFKDDGISGIVVMNMSSRLNREAEVSPYLEIDLLPGYNPKNLKGALNPKLYEYVIKNNIDPHHMIIRIDSKYDASMAQVISGGVDLNQISNDFSLRKDENIYLMGEMLDIDGVCGGFNLTFAFASAEIVKRSIENENSN